MVIFIILGLEFGLKANLRRWIFRNESTQLILMCSDEKLFDVSMRSSFNCFSYFVVVIMGSEVDGVSKMRVTTLFSMVFDENLFISSFGTLVSSERHNNSCSELRWSISSCLFLATSAVLLLVVQIFDHIFSQLLQFFVKGIIQYSVLFFRSLIRWSNHGFISLII